MLTDVLTLAILVRSFYILCTIAIIAARLLPPLRERFLVYGARNEQTIKKQDDVALTAPNTSISQMLNWLATLHVPHAWFTHFYLLSVIATCFWLWAFPKLVKSSVYDSTEQLSSQSQDSAYLCLLLMLLQGVRRLYESIRFSKTSTSRMWVGHYLFGIAFYLITNVAIWVESTNGYKKPTSGPHDTYAATSWIIKTFGMALFCLASLLQFQSHSYLAGLKKYTLPNSRLFTYLIAPHYTSECVIYLSLAMVGAPRASYLNHTLLFTVLLTVVNLGITSEGTKLWMMNKFRDQQPVIASRWRLIPGIW